MDKDGRASIITDGPKGVKNSQGDLQAPCSALQDPSQQIASPEAEKCGGTNLGRGVGLHPK